MFSFVVPLKPEVLAAIQTIHVKSGNQELAHRTASTASGADFQTAVRIQDMPNRGLQMVWDAESYPVLMLRDAHTGEVCGFVRGGNAQIEAAPGEVIVHAPDGLRSEVVRHRRIPE
jgi:hypothetical protein